MFLFKLAKFRGRVNFGQFLNDRHLTNYGVEIGTHRGEFADQLLSTWTGKLTCVDPWTVSPGYEYQARYLGSGTRDDHKQEAESRLKKYGDRANIIQGTSEQACRFFDDGVFDFVYNDGNHEPPHVAEDIRRWWPKLGHGGILAGHDILMTGDSDPDWDFHVQSAVWDFARAMNVVVYLVPEDNANSWSYYMEKP